MGSNVARVRTWGYSGWLFKSPLAGGGAYCGSRRLLRLKDNQQAAAAAALPSSE